ncbi:hypothetical protein SCLCIDRAFT_1158135 [Scleroderma citrinum Foug A]|uniref:Uncharacterized protein n=1 Tax=Scleroderma citrinum Foug A TaxID=1036808 RepID=A0A0C3DB52_9AGAM|nr:hypothetical protein SCLCIDRAFT_1158135 [Scleroderma citrinum Foug A]
MSTVSGYYDPCHNCKTCEALVYPVVGGKFNGSTGGVSACELAVGREQSRNQVKLQSGTSDALGCPTSKTPNPNQNGSYDQNLLDEAPRATRAQLQGGYDVDLLDDRPQRSQSVRSPVPLAAPSSGVPPPIATATPAIPENISKENFASAESGGVYTPAAKRPFWRTPKGIIILAAVAIVIIVAAVVGGVVGGSKKSSNTSSSTAVAPATTSDTTNITSKLPFGGGGQQTSASEAPIATPSTGSGGSSTSSGSNSGGGGRDVVNAT